MKLHQLLAVLPTVKTKKIADFVVAYEATEHHPAQIRPVRKLIAVSGHSFAAIPFGAVLSNERTSRSRLQAITIIN